LDSTTEATENTEDRREILLARVSSAANEKLFALWGEA